MNLAILSSAGPLFLFRWLHIVFAVLWVSVICVHVFGKQATISYSWWQRLSGVFVFLSGFLLFYKTPTPLKSSWGYSLLLGSFIGLVMLINQFLPASRKNVGAVLSFIFLFPALFFMSMASHMDMQVFPTSSIVKALSVSLSPVLVLEAVLLILPRNILRSPYVAGGCGLFLTGICYYLLELFSK